MPWQHFKQTPQYKSLAYRRVFKDTGRLLAAFLIGSAATVVGTLIAFKALPLLDMGADGWKVYHAALNTQMGKETVCLALPAVQ